jgi:hypothetical protein
MKLEEKVLNYVNGMPRNKMVSSQDIATAISCDAFFVKAMCEALEGDGEIRFVSQTAYGESPKPGVINGGKFRERERHYTSINNKTTANLW